MATESRRNSGYGERMAQLVDWDLAENTAHKLRRTGPQVTYEEAVEVVADLRRLTDEAADHVADYTGLRPQVEHPPVRVVDRADWASVNISGLRQTVSPLIEQLAGERGVPTGLPGAVSARVAGVQTGTVLAYLSGKVLGQYEVFTGDPGQLLLVAPNVVEAERKLQADPRDFRLWVCLHEVTHRTQFTAVPWLRSYFLSEVQAFVDAARAAEQPLLDRLRAGMSSLADAVRDPDSRASVLDVIQTPAQREVLDRLTAVMTLLEGHAEYVMDGVGPHVIPDRKSVV